MKYMVVAGEASGDLHAAGLMKALKALDPEARFRFFGGDLMAAQAGGEPDVHFTELNYMGFTDVIRHLPSIMSHLRRARTMLEIYRPDALILVDYPGFNLRLAKYARRLGIPVHYFISPKLWAWKSYRIKTIKRDVTRLYSILPFEVPYYAQRGYKAQYVGNPSVREIDSELQNIPSLRHFFNRHGVTDRRKVIALLPGSRRSEISSNLPIMIAAAKRFPEFQYVVVGAPSVPLKFYREIAHESGLNVVFGSTAVLVKHSEAALVTSGTATLETALAGTPQVVCYRANGSKLTYKLMEKLLHVRYVSLPNLIMGSEIVPELLLHNCTADTVARRLGPLLQPSPTRDWQLNGYKSMRRKLGTQDATATAAEFIYDSLTSNINH